MVLSKMRMYQFSAWEETNRGLVLVEEEGAMDFPFSDLDLLGIFRFKS